MLAHCQKIFHYAASAVKIFGPLSSLEAPCAAAILAKETKPNPRKRPVREPTHPEEAIASSVANGSPRRNKEKKNTVDHPTEAEPAP
ncbi:hypothetical protein EW145_g3995 [Phellinidium pouzarii]|uniref:Uncharacterized protein n=1 Tax=Phellinidium pouzarii TaxID=167371 RepID=A0A4S4L5B8_9AGAM|nr:hypothetical protein EW145_g3995 [Phellinidium pouzarii]